MSQLMLTGVGEDLGATTSASTQPTALFWDNMDRGLTFVAISNGAISFQRAVFPMNLSANTVGALLSLRESTNSTMGISAAFMLYSTYTQTILATNTTMTVFNPFMVAQVSSTFNPGAAATSKLWLTGSFASTSNFSAGAWFAGVWFSTAGAGSFSVWGNTSLNPANVNPALLMDHFASNDGTPVISKAWLTTSPNIGNDAFRQPYIIITA